MKLRRCDLVPLSVANWLCEELDERGIPGTAYSHTLLSLLHPYFCPHPVPKNPNHSSKCLVQSESLRSFLKAGQAREFEILFEELEEHVHPDADFPDLIIPDNGKTGSKKAKKRLKKKLQEFTNTPEKLWKEAAHQCLSTASDDRANLKVVIDELFKKLKRLTKETLDEEIKPAFSDFEPKNYTVPLHSSYFKSSQKNTLHSSNFPPLASPPKVKESSDKTEVLVDWKSLIKTKLSPVKETSPPIISSNLIGTPRDVKRNLELEFSMVEDHNFRSAMEISSNQFIDNPQLVDLKSTHFLPIITPGQTGFYSNEASYDDVFESSQESQSESIQEKLEGWERAPVVPTRGNREVTFDLLGSRLFERSANTTRCNSISELDDDRLKDMQKNISHSAAQLWGCNTAESWKNEKSDFAWGVSAKSPENNEQLGSHLVNSWIIPDESNWNSESDGNLNSLPLSKSWTSAAAPDWGTRALLNSTNDPFMRNDLETVSFINKKKDDDSLDFKLGRGNIKDIWSDCNDNNVPVENKHRELESEKSDGTNAFQKENSEERLCLSFRSLGLEHLWHDSRSSINTVVPRSFNTQTSGIEPESGGDLFSRDDLYNMKMKYQEEMDPNYYKSSIPSGPNGPYVELKHTEYSGFSTVVPHKTTEGEILHDELTNEQDGNSHNCEQEEENLLTSPRTHFRPIRQDTNGSTQEETKFEENQTILNVVSDMQDSNLVFQRTESGNLFLESDIVEGSPKKYMIYREPSVKTSLDTANDVSLVSPEQPSNVQSFIPKFKIINNEKFSQTEQGSSVNLGQNIDKELMSLKIFKSLKSENQTDSVESIWKSEHATNLKMLWGETSSDMPPTKEAWEITMTEPSLSLPKWSTNDLNTIDWNKDNLLPNYGQDNNDDQNPKDNRANFSKIKFIWHDSMLKTVKKSDSESSQDSDKIRTEKDKKSFDSDLKIDDFSNAKKSTLNCAANPWNAEFALDTEQTTESYESAKMVDPLWRLQWDADQDTDDILGVLPTSLKSPLPSDDSATISNTYRIDDKELDLTNFFETQEVNQPVEDLDNLEPGWDLNEGFEWGPAAENDEEDEQEVFIYENEDGQTVIVPVEYIDDTLYDEIFGSETNIPIGGSLPDLPQGHMAEWKKLSRRSKGTRFVPPSRRPCSFYLEGNCRRSDCKFSHDLTAITCRFWEEGSCLKGDTCPFRHGVAPPRRRNRSEGDQVSLLDSFNFSLKEGNCVPAVSKSRPIPRKNRGSSISMSSFEIDSETDFPCLGSSLDSKPDSLEDTTMAEAMNIAKLAKKKKKFIAVAKQTHKDCDMAVSFGRGSKITRSERRKAKNVRISTLSNAFNEELLRKSVRDKEKVECESLRKILRKRHATAPHQSPYRHEDGTLSDF